MYLISANSASAYSTAKQRLQLIYRLVGVVVDVKPTNVNKKRVVPAAVMDTPEAVRITTKTKCGGPAFHVMLQCPDCPPV